MLPPFKRGPKDLLRNCRPGAVTSGPEKIMEVIAESGLRHVQKVVGNRQHGFTEGKSHLTHLPSATH